MRVRGDNAPSNAFSLEAQPNKPGVALVRFYENAEPFEEKRDELTISGWVYDEYHLELNMYDGLSEDILGNYAGYLAQAKLHEAEGKTIPSLQQQVADLETDKAALTEKFIKELHLILKNGTSDSRKDWFAVGDYKKLPNEVGGMETALPEEVADRMKKLLSEYNNKKEKTFDDILDFHVKFERIHPFQDGNGRVGRLIMFKECLKYNIVPFIIEDNLKMFYYRGLKEWDNEKGYLTDTCLTAQDRYKAYLDYFRIAY